MEYFEVKNQIIEKLSGGDDFADGDNLLKLGLNSLQIMRLVNQWRKEGIKLSFGSLMENPTLEAWWDMIQKKTKKDDVAEYEKRTLKTNEPFPLTDVQYAYRIGREDDQNLGGVGCHAYLEFDGENVDIVKLENAWNILQYHHPMLRARFLEDGTQEIMERPYNEKLKILDFTGLDKREIQKNLCEVREQISYRKLQIEKGEVAGICVSVLPDNRTRIHLDVDLLIADVQSLQILLRDLLLAYDNKTLSVFSKDWSFADYLERQEKEEREERKLAKEYWKNRLSNFPGAPELPLSKRPEDIEKTKFVRRMIHLEKSEWNILQQRACTYKTTPAMLLLTAYAVVLERWSSNKRFLINIPFFNRKTENKGLEDVIADFTTLLLLEVNCEENPSFLELLERIQKQIHQDMKYTMYSGVQVQRDFAQLHGNRKSIAPVVFACNLGAPLVSSKFEKQLGEFSYMISQTPQVWLDFQTYENEKGLMLAWDTVDELFPEQMIENMLESFEYLLKTLVKADWNQNFDILPQKQKAFIENESKVEVLKNPQCLHQAFLDWADKTPDSVAVVDTKENISLTYKQLKESALSVAANIMESNIYGEPVAVSVERGYKQVIAVLGVLMSGNCYVPVGTNQPAERKKLIYEKTGIKYAILDRKTFKTTECLKDIEIFTIEEILQNVKNVALPQINPKNTAYIIMTSGSTGIPKGVEIAHYSAWNTIRDIIDKYNICNEDSVLCVSALDFDLSVFDIFGLLGCGGRIILIPEEARNDSEYWIHEIKKYKITVWNSVPILLEMLLTSADEFELPFRIAIVSGDWISLQLPEKLRNHAKTCRFIAMGGATEGSIWSNYQEVRLPIPDEWKSIPYGKPLNNQRYRVVDSFGRDCPVWVPGELWIGGYGVAKGYRNDIQLTSEKFVEDKLGRWYKTGDNGRFWNDYSIEFLGRKDNQVKVKGHRIEIGEIESCLEKKNGVKKAVVLKKDNALKAYVELDRNIESPWLVKNKILSDNAVIEAGRVKEIEKKKIVFESMYSIETLNSAGMYLAKRVLNELEVFGETKRQYSMSELLENGLIAKEYAGAFKRVLKICVDNGTISKSDDIFSDNSDESVISDLAIPSVLRQTIDASVGIYCSVLRGEMTTAELVLDSEYQLSPLKLYMNMHHENEFNVMKKMVQDIILAIDRNVNILEVGSRIYNWTDSILDVLTDKKQYTFADSHVYFLDKFRMQYGESMNTYLLDFDKALLLQGVESRSFTCVVSNNALHRYKNIDFILKNIYQILEPGGFFIFNENVCDNDFSTVAASIYENGFENFTDFRKETGGILIPMDKWVEHLEMNGFHLVVSIMTSENKDEAFVVAQKNPEEKIFDKDGLKSRLSQELPYFMIPEDIVEIDYIPISSNGKVDRKILQNSAGRKVTVKDSAYEAPETDLEKKIVKVWEDVLGVNGIGISDKLLNIGGDSLKATKIVNKLREMGFETTLRALYESETVKEYCKNIKYKFGEFCNSADMDSGEI